jgi:membrane-associated phospholipid phosphatase
MRQCLLTTVTASLILWTVLVPAPAAQEVGPFGANPIRKDEGVPGAGSVTQSRFASLDRYVTDFTSRLMHDYSVQSQFLFRGTSPKRFALGALGITALLFADRVTYNALRPQEHFEDPRAIVQSAATLSKWGNTASSIPLVVGFGAIGLLTGSTREKETSSMLAQALITSGTWTYLLKRVGGRERPRELDGRVADWMGPANVFNDDPTSGEGYRSFPSGHSTGAWAVATILANQYPRYEIVPIVAYGTATAMSYSRMVLGAHWLSDVVVGGLIGYGCAKQVLSSHESVAPPTVEPQVRIGADVLGDYKGVRVTVAF